MQRATRDFRFVLLVLSLLSAVSPEAAAAQTGTLNVAIPAVPALLDPASALEGPVSLISRQVFDTLVRYADGSSDVRPGLASQWSVSRDGLTWSFRLRDGVRFHDGTPLTVQHVVDSLDRLVRPGHPLAPAGNPVAPRLLRGAPGVIKEIRAVDARTVAISLVLPYAPLVAVLAHPAFSIVLPAPPGGPAGAPFQGTGPFAIAETAPGRVTLEARPGHWGGGPHVSRVVFTDAASNETQALGALDAGMLDIVLPAGAPPRQVGAVSIPGWRVGFLALQTEKEPFSRVKVRRATAIALDPALIGQAVGAAAVPLQTFLPPGAWARRDAPVALEGSAERAKRLVAEAAPRRGAAPELLAPDGIAPGDVLRLADAVRTALAAADLPLNVRVQPLESALPLMRAGEPAASLWEARLEAGDPHFLLYPLSASEGAVKGGQVTNLSFYRNSRLDDLLIRASQLSFRPERLRLYTRAQAMLAEEVPWIPLYVRLHWAVVRPEVRNFRLHPSGNHRLDQVSVDRQ